MVDSIPHVSGRYSPSLCAEFVCGAGSESLPMLAFHVEQGLCEKLGLRPDQQTGQYSKHFDAVVDCRPADSNFYDLPMGRRLRHQSMRRFDEVPIAPLHELLAEEFSDKSEELTKGLEEAKESDALPRVYHEHPFVSRSTEPVLPYCVYLDGVKYTRTDSVLGIFVYFFIAGVRHLVACVRKSEFCSCGCGGWCTIEPLMMALRWSMVALAQGVWPSARHDGSGWMSSDFKRSQRAGQPLGFRAVCLFIKADWAEYLGTMGFTSWSSLNSPCPFCLTDLERFFSLHGYSALSMPSSWKTLRHYETACEACERTVWIDTREMQRHVASCLEYDKRKQGGKRGRPSRLQFLLWGWRPATGSNPDRFCEMSRASRICVLPSPCCSGG